MLIARPQLKAVVRRYTQCYFLFLEPSEIYDTYAVVPGGVAMKTQYIFLLFVIFASFSCSRATEQDSKASKPVQVFSLPDNPCEVLNSAQVSAITGLEVISAKRVPSIEKIVNAQSKNREPSPGTI
jgi:hypothetical protein